MKIKVFKPKRSINIKHRKEKHFMESYTGVVVDDKKLKEVVDLRIYGTSAMNYACVWIHDNKNDIHANGSGSADGFGYHRPSAAAARAIASMGLELSQDIGGRGNEAIEDAVMAIVRKLYPRNKIVKIIKAHP